MGQEIAARGKRTIVSQSMKVLTVGALALLALLAGCGKKPKRARIPAPPPASAPKAIPRPPGWTETGIASWYGYPYHGRQAANGETYDMNGMTAAHRTLPFETWVRVTNLTNLKQVEVRITDRGPFIDGRIIDLSRKAAELLDMVIAGLAKVRLEVISAPAAPAGRAPDPPQNPQPDAAARRFAVQVGAFRDETTAGQLRAEMERAYGFARVQRRQAPPALYRVLVGAAATREEAEALAARVRREQAALAGAFVTEIE
jgi:rare lipoprotein A